MMGQTGAIAPGLCGAVRVATEGEDQAETSLRVSDFERLWSWSGSHQRRTEVQMWLLTGYGFDQSSRSCK